MISRLILKSALIISSAMLVPSATAATTVYTDRASFNSAIGSTTIVDFNDFTNDTSFQNTELDLGPFSIVGTGTNQLNRNLVDATPLQFGVFNVDGTSVANLLINTNSTVTLTFKSAIFAFGADFADLNNIGQSTSIIVNGNQLTPENMDGNQVRFFGFTSDTAFTSLTFTAGTNSDGFGMDNVALAAVPEPTTWAMFILGFGLVGASMRRRKGTTAQVSFA